MKGRYRPQMRHPCFRREPLNRHPPRSRFHCRTGNKREQQPRSPIYAFLTSTPPCPSLTKLPGCKAASVSACLPSPPAPLNLFRNLTLHLLSFFLSCASPCSSCLLCLGSAARLPPRLRFPSPSSPSSLPFLLSSPGCTNPPKTLFSTLLTCLLTPKYPSNPNKTAYAREIEHRDRSAPASFRLRTNSRKFRSGGA